MASKKSKFYADKAKKQEIIKKYGLSDSDTGSPMVQIAILTERITYLTNHLKTHKKDNHSRRGLLKLVGSRRRMIKYLNSVEKDESKVSKFLKDIGM